MLTGLIIFMYIILKAHCSLNERTDRPWVPLRGGSMAASRMELRSTDRQTPVGREEMESVFTSVMLGAQT